MPFMTSLWKDSAEVADPPDRTRAAVDSGQPGRSARIGCDREHCQRYATDADLLPGDPEWTTTVVASEGDTGQGGQMEPSRQSFWSELSTADQRELLRLGTPRTFPPGAALLRQNDPSNQVFLLRTGCVKVVWHGDDGNYVVLGIRDPGDIVGEMSSLLGQPRSASVYAIREVEAVVIPAGWFNAFVRGHIDAAVALHWSFCARLREADRARRDAAIRSVEQRLAALLLDLAERYGDSGEAGGVIVIDLPLSQDDIAGLVLASRRTLARALMQLRRDHVIVTGRRRITIEDPAALRALLS